MVAPLLPAENKKMQHQPDQFTHDYVLQLVADLKSLAEVEDAQDVCDHIIKDPIVLFGTKN